MIIPKLDEILTVDGMDEAMIGICAISNRRIYSYQRMMIILMRDEGLNEIDAIEHLEVNVVNAWVGEGTPIYMHEVEEFEINS